jgi:hypothetical protein
MKLKYFARLGASIVMLATTTTPLITTVNAEIVTEAKQFMLQKEKELALLPIKNGPSAWHKQVMSLNYLMPVAARLLS